MKLRKINKRATASILVMVMCIGLVASQLFGISEPGFNDVPASHWAYSYIMKATELGIINGVGDNKFDPNSSVTYAQMATMMTRLLYAGEEDSYTGGQWWSPYVKVADDHGLWVSTAMESSSSWSETANKPVSRAHMAQIIYNGIRDVGVEMPPEAVRNTTKSLINDYAKIPSINRTAVTTCYALVLLMGTDGNKFAPTQDMTRAQAAVVICRTYGLVTGDVTGSGAVTTPNVPESEKPSSGKPEGAIGGKYDINRYDVPADVNKDGYLTEAEVQAVIDQLEAEYPDGTIWGADGVGRYVSKAMGSGTGCAGWAYLVSDRIFGNLPRRQTYDVYNQHIGDLTYVDVPHWTVYLGHEVIDGIVYDDGCVSTSTGANSPIQWYVSGGLYATRAEAMNKGTLKIYTRYPVE